MSVRENGEFFFWACSSTLIEKELEIALPFREARPTTRSREGWGFSAKTIESIKRKMNRGR